MPCVHGVARHVGDEGKAAGRQHPLAALLFEKARARLCREVLLHPIQLHKKREYFSPAANQLLKRNLLSVEGSMIDAVVNVAVFAALVMCIVGFGAWVRRRVP